MAITHRESSARFHPLIAGHAITRILAVASGSEEIGALHSVRPTKK